MLRGSWGATASGQVWGAAELRSLDDRVLQLALRDGRSNALERMLLENAAWLWGARRCARPLPLRCVLRDFRGVARPRSSKASVVQDFYN